MTLNLFGSRRLLLAGASLGWLWVAAGGIALVLLLVLYREERRLVSRRTGLGLLGLRLTAAAVLVLALFEPIASRSYRETTKGRVIVAVDVSESMTTADPDRPGTDRQRLAKTLRMSPGESVENLSRREIARRLLTAKGAAIDQIERIHGVEAFAFARESAPATLAALAETLKQPGKPDDPATSTTDWQPVLAGALRESDAPVLGIVLLTDGRQNAPGDSTATVDRLAARGIPIYPILIGSTIAPRDAAVASVRAPEGVYKGDVASIEATLKLDGYAGREVAVTLERPGAAPLRRQVRAPDETASVARPVVSFSVPMTESGTVPLTIAISPLEGDVRPDNDRRTVSVQVSDDKAAVLLVDGEARWEFRYLRNALARDPQVKVEAIVFHQPEATGVSTQTTYGTTLPPRPEPGSAPDLTDPLGGFDAIVLGDVDPADLRPDTWARLESYVSERGGTLILSPGPRFWPSLASHETARKLLPVLAPRPVAIDPGQSSPGSSSLPPGAAVLPTLPASADSAAWPMLQFGSDPEQSRLLWAGLPRLPWALAGKPKPGATTLALAGDEATAVIAAQAYGLGKVLWIGTDGTWRWRYRVGDAYHHRFWGQTVRWAASGKLAAGNAFVRFGPVRPRVADGEPVRLQARIAEGILGAGPDLLIAARVFKAGTTANPQATGDAVAVVPLRPVPGQPRAYEGDAPTLPLGRYVIRLDVPQLTEALHLNDGGTSAQALLEVVTHATSERVELAVDRAPATRLAVATGGRVLADFEADSLPPLLRSRTRPTVRTEETPLWDHPAALLLFFAIVTCEWVVRKRVGLP
ncbi:hypothetical protein SAMN05444166_3779 [Singulisphaera sp. GP187]|uniref:VWA domain-containing protein n=1 Tax=Singulisphaera sp. GP187 TaxID=1882752 RepID=UPI00092A6172|nr:VWA domain-containing protein [Singulisphaera sp. GP187]SIO32298.1 hypothetical protein SAMN05444166_3779 [Singulisphaera sp. GP187]